ncbi:putative efflux protein, MATE family [Marinitoga hydrogenitolerans DSM 16785]|uniref:Efflux protein, MATE family n=1 Tax=Marinitoga hydrogenitolerans (strain DSM 16785 / JCM 12826 / AT1271) TaxID=1122195 RepID=A0A1M4SYQ1_MARH1|nr:MATE family efflux transporter [Marinitoga hydrogenitolerans]SHE37342.1 putative efflux protein, MATE family [Marinitoga hydrogenitolerans DSM 16785]
MEKDTKGTILLKGDPKKAIIKLSIPLILAMLVQTLYNLIDSIWVAGLGSNALAAIGLYFPIFMIVISLASGLGVGASSAISRKIGEKDKSGADSAAIISIFLSIIIGVITTIVFLTSIRSILTSLGTSKKTLQLSLDYAYILIFFSPLLIFNNTANGILRGEGDAKKAMYAIAAGSLLNIGLDPLFIYGFKLGIKGAAYATVISFGISTLLIIYWMFIKKDTYLTITFKDYKYDSKILKDILKVGIPASLSQISMSVAIFVLNIFAVKAGGDLGVAVFTSSWRIINFGTVPLIGIAMAVTSVTGAAYGQKNSKKLSDAHLFSIKFGEIISFFVMTIIFVFSPQIAKLFTYSKGSSVIYNDLVIALKVMSLFLPGVPFGMFTSSMFQGIGQGIKSFVASIYRTLIMQVFFSWLYVFALNFGLIGVWWGIVTGNAASSIITFTWGRVTINKIKYLDKK